MQAVDMSMETEQMPRNVSVRVRISKCSAVWLAHSLCVGNHGSHRAAWEASFLFQVLLLDTADTEGNSGITRCHKALTLRHRRASCLQIEQYEKGKAVYQHLPYSQSLLIVWLDWPPRASTLEYHIWGPWSFLQRMGGDTELSSQNWVLPGSDVGVVNEAVKPSSVLIHLPTPHSSLLFQPFKLAVMGKCHLLS